MASATQNSFEETLAASWPVADWREVTVVIAVSGGPDSVALLRAMKALKMSAAGAGRLIVAHFNHRLRAEAEADAQFVKTLAEKLELPFEVGQADTTELAAKRGDGIEEAARQARYEFLQQVAQRRGARYVATAHTSDDQVETVLFNILRGAGLNGVAGMPRARQLGPAISLIRPLLTVRREELLKYLKEIGQEYQVDATNACFDYTRNRLRHELLPLLRANYKPDVASALLRLSQIARDAQRVIERAAAELLESALIPGPPSQQQARLSVARFPNCDRHLVREMFVVLWRRMEWPLQQMGFTEWDALATMAQFSVKNDSAEFPAKRVFPANICVERAVDQLIVTRVDT